MRKREDEGRGLILKRGRYTKNQRYRHGTAIVGDNSGIWDVPLKLAILLVTHMVY